jgi:hypothetical protein
MYMHQTYHEVSTANEAHLKQSFQDSGIKPWFTEQGRPDIVFALGEHPLFNVIRRGPGMKSPAAIKCQYGRYGIVATVPCTQYT